MQGESFSDTSEAKREPWFRRLGETCAGLLRAPTQEEQEAYRRAEKTKRWNKMGPKGFIVIRGLESGQSTPEQNRGLHPADSLPIESAEQE